MENMPDDTMNKIEEESNEIEFYIVSPQKFLILFIGTFGLYGLFWFYQHWSLYKKSVNGSMWPIMRALFSIFFVHALFSLFEMKYTFKTAEKPKSINYLATIYVVFAIACQIASKLSDSGYGNPFTLVFSLLLMPISCWVLYQAQSLANYSGYDVQGESNSQLTTLNYFFLVLGAIFWLLTIVGIVVTVLGIESKI